MNTDKWVQQIDRITESYNNAFDKLTLDQLNWKPDEKTWSVAQNIDHIIILNESYYPILQDVTNETSKVPVIGKFKFIANFIGRKILKAVAPDRKKKMKTFRIWEPPEKASSDNLLDRFKSHQEELKNKINLCRNIQGKETVISSPLNKYIVYDIETAFDIILSHEERHLEQAKELINSHPEVFR